MYQDTMDNTYNNLYGYETEEERRRRLAEMASLEYATSEKPIKQTITTDPRTGEQSMKIEGSVQDLSAQNPSTPTVVGPVNPESMDNMQMAALNADQVAQYNKMRQIESGNRDYDSQGRPIVSPKGAMYAGQVMPNTARDPGFGVRPAQNNTPEEFNRVGVEYYDAMLRKYNGNEQLAQAAYNAGPGRVDQAIRMSQQRGGDPLQYLPRETQQYVQQVGGNQAALNRQQVQQNQPAQQNTQAQPSIYSLQQPRQNQATNMPGVGLEAQPTNTAGLEQMQRNTFGTSIPHVEEYLANKGNLTGLLQLSQNDSNPEWIRTKARQDVGFELANEKAKKEAESRIQNMTPMDLERALRERTTGGSWVKAIAFSMLGMNVSAEAEAAKLGIGKEQAVLGPDGTPYLVKVSSNGTPIDGFNAKTGKQLTANELVTAMAGSAGKLDLVGGSYINDKTQEVGRMVTDQRTGQSYIQTDTGRKPMAGFRPQSSTGSLQDMRARALQDLNIRLMGKTKEQAMQILMPYNQQLVASGFDPISVDELRLQTPQVQEQRPSQQVQGGQVQGNQVVQPSPVAPVPTVTPPRGNRNVPGPINPNAPVPAPTVGRRPTGPEMTAQAEALKKGEVAKAEDLAKVQIDLPKTEENADYLVTKIDELTSHPGFERSVGIKGAGMLFGLRDNPISGTAEADWMSRFKEIQGQSFLQGIQNLRGMGALSNQEGEAATKAIQRMNTSQSEAEFKAAAADFKEIITRGVDIARTKLGMQPKYNTTPESKQQEPSKAPEKLTKQDRDAIEWLRNNPNDPRAARIRKSLGL